MPELLLELGCEELPASFVRKAYADLEAAITTRLADAGIPFGASTSLGTPRRLIVRVQDLAERQPDLDKEQRGPALAAAFDSNGNPTKALEGFCRGQCVDPAQVRKQGDYVWIRKTIAGRPTAEVLATLLPDAIRSLTFDKAMRWGTLRTRFARPIRWILAAFGDRAVAFDLDGIEAGIESRGHRFNSPGAFEATSFDQLLSGLRERQVEPDPAKREHRLREETVSVASGTPDMSSELVEENVFLTEWPVAIEGSFREEYLDLPAPVLVTAMAKHEKFFPIRDAEGKLINRFVSIRNGGVDDVVREGNAWVLNARFNDAKFFFDEDLKHSLHAFLEKAKGIVFQQELGTVFQRAYRLAELAEEVAKATSADADEVEYAKKAGLYCKADLSTGLVSELPALQGLIGAEYGRREGLPDAVCWAIGSHYDLTQNLTIDCAGARTAVRVIIADQLDKLAGYLGVGQIPSGSSDPYGLRRAATLLIEAALRWPTRFRGYKDLIERARDCYRIEGLELAPSANQLAELFRSRYASIFSDSRYDLVEAALLNDYAGQNEALDPQGVKFRIEVLQNLVEDVPFVQTATRPQNILTAAVSKHVPFTFEHPLRELSRPGLQSQEAEMLLDALQQVSGLVSKAVAEEDAPAVSQALKQLEKPINDFFDTTMVMADDEQVRGSRLTLLHGVNLVVREAGDFSRIVIAGDTPAKSQPHG